MWAAPLTSTSVGIININICINVDRRNGAIFSSQITSLFQGVFAGMKLTAFLTPKTQNRSIKFESPSPPPGEGEHRIQFFEDMNFPSVFSLLFFLPLPPGCPYGSMARPKKDMDL